MKIRYEVNPREAPCAILVRNDTDERTVLIQLDWDYPSLASTFGWQPDGTIDCSHKTASEHIREAFTFLRSHEGEEAEDSGYFADHEGDHLQEERVP